MCSHYLDLVEPVACTPASGWGEAEPGAERRVCRPNGQVGLVRGADGGWRVTGLQSAAFVGHAGGVAVAASVLQDALDHRGPAP
jgi:hypothetical protein